MPSRSSALIQAIRVEDGIFWFDLEETIVSTIREIRIQQGPSPHTLFLTVPRWLRRWLRKASVFDITEETAKDSPHSREHSRSYLPPRPVLPPIQQSGMTFISCYPRKGTRDKVCILETIVGLDGDVLNKVQAQLLASEDAEDISAAHFWLIDQLLLALRQDTDGLLNTITWASIGLPIGLGVATLWNNGDLAIQDAIVPFIGSGFSSLFYGTQDHWKPWIHARLSQWGWSLLKKQLGFPE